MSRARTRTFHVCSPIKKDSPISLAYTESLCRVKLWLGFNLLAAVANRSQLPTRCFVHQLPAVEASWINSFTHISTRVNRYPSHYLMAETVYQSSFRQFTGAATEDCDPFRNSRPYVFVIYSTFSPLVKTLCGVAREMSMFWQWKRGCCSFKRGLCWARTRKKGIGSKPLQFASIGRNITDPARIFLPIELWWKWSSVWKHSGPCKTPNRLSFFWHRGQIVRITRHLNPAYITEQYHNKGYVENDPQVWQPP